MIAHLPAAWVAGVAPKSVGVPPGALTPAARNPVPGVANVAGDCPIGVLSPALRWRMLTWAWRMVAGSLVLIACRGCLVAENSVH